MSLTSWFLVSSGGTRHRLPREMIFVGRDDCELMLQSRSVDKQHAVINYDSATDEHKVKDLGSLNGTFVNDVRIQEQMYVTLKMDDKLRFGYDILLELHEKFTSQLQLPQKTSEGKGSKAASTKAAEAKAAEAAERLPRCAEAQKLEEKMSADMAAMHRGTPLYGQPSWWGDDDADDENSFKQETKAGGKKLEGTASADMAAMHRGTPLYGQPSWWGDDDADDENSFKQETKAGGKKLEGTASGENKEHRKAEAQGGNEEALYSLCREPSYFEIPTKEFQQPAPMVASTIHEIPTKDTEGAHAAAAGHASFTIEFDDNTPGKVTIKDHMTKFNPDQHPRPKKSSPQGGKELSTLQATMIAAESKVSDWLAKNDPPMARRESTEDDSKSIKSDVPVQLKRLKGSKHEDGTQSDSENGAKHRHTSKRTALEEHVRVWQGPKRLAAASAEGKGTEGTRISRTDFMVEFFDEDNPRMCHSYSFTQNGAAAMAGEGPCLTLPSGPKGLVPTDCKGVPSPLAAPPPSKLLLKQKLEDPSMVRTSASVGQQTSPNEEAEKSPKPTGTVEKENEDDQSDKGTYTIELENRNPEEEEARRMIDKVFGIEESQDHSRPVVPEQQKGTIKDWASSRTVEMRKSQFGTAAFIDSEYIEGFQIPKNGIWLQGSKHEDGTQSDSENGAKHRHTSKRAALEEHVRVWQGPKRLAAASAEGKGTEGTRISRTDFMVEFFDEDNPRMCHSYSFTQNGAAAMAGEGPCLTLPSGPKGLVPTDCKGVPSPLAAPPPSKLLLKQKLEDPSLVRTSASVGQQTSPNEEAEKSPKPTGTVEKENEDDQSDKGTYTIELENRNPEEEEARRMIDKVFGIEESQDHSRPVVAEQQKETIKDWASSGMVEMRKSQFGTAAFIDSETIPEGPVSVGSPRWVSQWASLAANHSGHEPDDLRSESPSFVVQEKEADVSESGISVKSITSATSTSSHGERKRRTLPQLPTEDKVTAKAVKGTTSLGLRSEIGEKQDTEPQEKEKSSRPSQKGREADRTSRTSHKAPSGSQIVLPPSQQKGKSDSAKGASVVKQAMAKIQQQEQRSSQPQWAPSKLAPGTNPPVSAEKSREVSSKHGSLVQKTSTNTDRKDEDRRRRADSPRSQISKVSESEKESGKPLVRQGSFTVEKPSTNVPLELIPRINKQGRERSDSVGTDSSMDTTLLLKDTEAVMAFLEAKLREENKLDGGTDTPSYHFNDSISPESDVDTASTISLVTGDTERKSAQKRRTLSSLYKEKSTINVPSRDHSKTAASARERLEKKTKSRNSDSRTEARRSAQASARARQSSLDLTDDDQTFSLPHFMISGIQSSDQEIYSGRSHGRGQFTSTDELLHSKLEASKTAKTKVLQASSTGPSKPATLPRPRPTRASLLRKARLGETSDNELADADKVSVASEVSTTSSTSKPPSGRKTPSRIDMLAQPRRTRLGSLSARSDSEAIVSRGSASSRTPDLALRSGLRPSSATDGKIFPRMRANSVSKLPDSKSKISLSAHSSPLANARWRRLPPDYASTSEDEFGSNRISPKHARLRAGTALRSTRLQPTASPGPGGVVLKHRMREQEEYIRDWTAHSEEIARISQDLAKDLATLAREIHDVAGEIDSVSSPSTAPSTTVSTAATTPGSAIDTREELVDRVFDESLNFRKIPPAVQNKAPEINGRPVELRPRTAEAPDPQAAIRRRTWNRDEVRTQHFNND
ncbi:UNVERIFIED_CONTAM: hypothetical protein FKN15_071739 [Acipenser sinensis]